MKESVLSLKVKTTQPWVAHFPITHKYFVFDYWAIESSSVVYIFNKGIIS